MSNHPTVYFSGNLGEPWFAYSAMNADWPAFSTFAAAETHDCPENIGVAINFCNTIATRVEFWHGSDDGDFLHQIFWFMGFALEKIARNEIGMIWTGGYMHVTVNGPILADGTESLDVASSGIMKAGPMNHGTAANNTGSGFSLEASTSNKPKKIKAMMFPWRI